MQDCLLGRSGKELAKSVYRAVEFANNQNELMLEAARDIERSKGKAMQQQMYTKMEELHNAYKKAKGRANALSQERDALEQDKKELQEKYVENTRQKRKLEEMFSALKNENDKLRSWRLAHVSGNDMDVTGRSHPTAARSLHHGAAAPSHLMSTPLMPTSSCFDQRLPPANISDRQFSPVGGRPSSAFGLRGSQQVSPAVSSFEFIPVGTAHNQLAHLGSNPGHSRGLGGSQQASHKGSRGAGAGKLSSSVLSLGAKQSPANPNELFGRRR
eukprot:256371-Prorocentrum_minimum.AAC.1